MMTDETTPTTKRELWARQTAMAMPIPIPAVHISTYPLRFYAKRAGNC